MGEVAQQVRGLLERHAIDGQHGNALGQQPGRAGALQGALLGAALVQIDGHGLWAAPSGRIRYELSPSSPYCSSLMGPKPWVHAAAREYTDKDLMVVSRACGR